MYRLGKDTYTAEVAHVESYMNRVNLPPCGIDIEYASEGIGCLMNRIFVQFVVRYDLAHVPQGLGTDRLGFIGLAGNIA